MDLNETLTFVKVVRLGSFSAAARALGLPVSTVSTRVARLEKRLGVTLLQRTTRRLSLTEKGQAYFDHAAQGLELMEVAESAVLASKQEPQGRLRVSAPVDLGYDGLARLMGRFRTAHPGDAARDVPGRRDWTALLIRHRHPGSLRGAGPQA